MKSKRKNTALMGVDVLSANSAVSDRAFSVGAIPCSAN